MLPASECLEAANATHDSDEKPGPKTCQCDAVNVTEKAASVEITNYDQDITFPDGGFRAWGVAFGVRISFFFKPALLSLM